MRMSCICLCWLAIEQRSFDSYSAFERTKHCWPIFHSNLTKAMYLRRTKTVDLKIIIGFYIFRDPESPILVPLFSCPLGKHLVSEQPRRRGWWFSFDPKRARGTLPEHIEQSEPPSSGCSHISLLIRRLFRFHDGQHETPPSI